MEDFDDDPLLAVAGYNWGEGHVMRARARNRARGKATDVWSLRLPRETRSHVSRLLAIAAIVKDPERFGVVLDPIPDRVHFREVALDSQIDLSLAADMAGITLDEIYLLNPGYKRWATDPDGPHRLQLPHNNVERFRVALAQLPGGDESQWERYRIVYGDTLAAIAKRYRTSVAVLMDFNRLRSDRIHAGRYLMVPASPATARGSMTDPALLARIQWRGASRGGDGDHPCRAQGRQPVGHRTTVRREREATGGLEWHLGQGSAPSGPATDGVSPKSRRGALRISGSRGRAGLGGAVVRRARGGARGTRSPVSRSATGRPYSGSRGSTRSKRTRSCGPDRGCGSARVGIPSRHRSTPRRSTGGASDIVSSAAIRSGRFPGGSAFPSQAFGNGISSRRARR